MQKKTLIGNDIIVNAYAMKVSTDAMKLFSELSCTFIIVIEYN